MFLWQGRIPLLLYMFSKPAGYHLSTSRFDNSIRTNSAVATREPSFIQLCSISQGDWVSRCLATQMRPSFQTTTVGS